ncbi:hypothetical protein FQ085_06535 [Planococcus sp. ANT_H30]|uniref:hypothetical protein n=1 Tax=Planococcus sp. ANT_H30 TaxID=2597347 RepID=UPI0011EF89FC|nr:hypothetical protein [Planococcus sp. ANT_H30]KAA0957703.1 hypothetical protein FQ085_06535 [Planococcus sp. ANT_H30]
MDNLTLISVIIAFTSLIYIAFSNSINSFRDGSKGYQKSTEHLYLCMLDIYSSPKDKWEEKIKELIYSFYKKNINTTLLLQEHSQFLKLKEKVERHEKYSQYEMDFHNLAKIIELIYWSNFLTHHYENVITGSFENKIKQRILWMIYKSSRVLKYSSYGMIFGFAALIFGLAYRTFLIFIDRDLTVNNNTLIFILVLIAGSILISTISTVAEQKTSKALLKRETRLKDREYIKKKVEEFI